MDDPVGFLEGVGINVFLNILSWGQNRISVGSSAFQGEL